jgi:hypothetical protein
MAEPERLVRIQPVNDDDLSFENAVGGSFGEPQALN